MISLSDFRALVTHVLNELGHPYVSADAIGRT